MSAIDIIIIVGCALAVVGAIITSILNKKRGKTSCGCDCANCSGCCNQSNKNKDTAKK